MRNCIVIITLIYLASGLQAQGEGNWWYFGDSTLLDFNFAPPAVNKFINMQTYAGGGAISNSQGNLLFVLGGDRLRDRNGDVLINGRIFLAAQKDSWGVTEGCQILVVDTHYYAFNLATGLPGNFLYYSTISPSANNGLGAVLQKRIPLDSNLTDHMAITRHANGRDWWIICLQIETNTKVKFLVTDSGVQGPFYQNIGQPHLFEVAYLGESDFSWDGVQYAWADATGKIDLYDFDRCSGELSNHRTLSSAHPNYHGVEFSPDGTKLYAIENTEAVMAQGRSYLYQYDLTASNISASRMMLWASDSSEYNPNQDLSGIELGPDGKMYVSHSLPDLGFQPPFICPRLGVIHNPNARGFACDFIPESFDLFPGRGKFGLPEPPNFKLGKQAALEADAGRDTTICHEGFTPELNGALPSFGDGAQIGTPDTSGGKCTFTWWPEDGLSDPFFPQPWADPEETTTYWLTVVDTTMNPDCGTTVDSVTVTVEFCKIPNVVTGNGDGINDVFKLKYLPEGTEVTIFDRWGRQVFHSNDYQNEWPTLNGPARNHQVTETVYYFIVQYPDRDEPEVGWVTVLF